MTSRGRMLVEMCLNAEKSKRKGENLKLQSATEIQQNNSIEEKSLRGKDEGSIQNKDDEIPSTSKDMKEIDFSDSGGSEYAPSSSHSSEEGENSRKVLRRWRKKNIENWKINVERKKRNDGMPYTSKKGKKQSAKVPKPVDCSKCRFKCSLKYDEDARTLLCREYWQLNFNRQKDYIIKAVLQKPVRRLTSNQKKKHYARTYFFHTLDQKQRVCKSFFTKTLCISHGPVDSALSGRSESGTFNKKDNRGKATPANKTSAITIQKVKDHIESFPITESHYCRKSSKRQYLDEKLSISKMYALYKEKCIEESTVFVSEITYRRYFCENYNLSFFKPKKDVCPICDKFKKLKEGEIEYLAHIRRRDDANAAKAADKERANKDNTFISVTFDLQSVLQIPSSDVSLMYYSRKLCAYNLTIYEAALPNKAHCYAWTELDGQRGSSEIGTALLKWFSDLQENVKEVSLFSDTCSGQNRNQFIAALFMYIVANTHVDTIQHNFLESGHSHMEVDSMHSAIESAKKYVSVYCMNDWLNIFKMSRSQKVKKNSMPYNVLELVYSDFKDLKALARKLMKNRAVDENGCKVNWLKIKCMRYEKSQPGKINFKYNYTESFKVLKVYTENKTRHINMPTELENLYRKQLPISSAKKQDLLKLCKKGIIPKVFHSWYESLPFVEKKDFHTEPAFDSDSADSE